MAVASSAFGGLGRGQVPSYLTRLHCDTILSEKQGLTYSSINVSAEGQKG